MTWTRGRIIGLVVAALLLGGAAIAIWVAGPENVVEVAETLGEGSERELQDELTPIRGTERMIFICFDGVGHDVLNEVIAAGRMPALQKVLGAREGDENAHAYSVPRMLSILPSTTVAAWTTVFTGVGVAEHGVAGNEQLNRESRHFYAPAPVSVSDIHEMMEAFNGGLVGEMVEVETLYEKLPGLRSHASLAHVHRGADLFTMPSGVDAAAIFGAFVEGVGEESGSQREGAQALDEQSIGAALGAIDEHGLPDLQVVYFPGIDLFTHVATNAIESQKNYLAEVTDPALGRLFERWEEAGVLEDTWVVLTSDHGHTPVLDDDRHSLDASDEEDEPPAVLRRLGFTMRPLEVGVAEGPWSAAVAYQGAFGYIHLADRSTCGDQSCDWTQPPRLDEDVLPVARAFYEASRAEGGPLTGAIDLVFAREPRPPNEDALPFQVFDGEQLVALGAYLGANPRPDLLRLQARLRELGAGPYGHRAGDVLLLTRSGADVPIEERFYFSGPYHSWHGSPAMSDSHIPLVVARQGMSGDAIARRVRAALQPTRGGWQSQREITPLLVTLLGPEPSGDP